MQHFGGFENPRRGRQARNLTTNVPKILDLKSSSEQIFSKNWRWVPLVHMLLLWYMRPQGVEFRLGTKSVVPKPRNVVSSFSFIEYLHIMGYAEDDLASVS